MKTARRASRLFRRNRESTGADYRSIGTRDHPIQKARGGIRKHRAVLYDKIGPGEHPCNWCEKLVHWTAQTRINEDPEMLMVDHVDGNKQNNDPGNLVPSCNACNIIRSHNYPEDAEFVISPKGVRSLAQRLLCGNCDKTFLAAKSKREPPKYCSKKCFYAQQKGKKPIWTRMIYGSMFGRETAERGLINAMAGSGVV